MKNIFLLFILLYNISFAQNNVAYIEGEELVYRVHYGFVDAGVAKLIVENEKRTFNNREVYHVIGTAKTNSTFDLFFKMRDRYESYIDKELLAPLFFYRNIDEDGYKFIETHIFNKSNNTVINKTKTYETSVDVQDMISVFYYARSLNFDNLKAGDVFTLPYFMTDKNYQMKLKYIGTENIKTDLGKFNCLVFRPMVEKGRVFKEEDDVTIWITNDIAHMPIRIQANLLVGSIKCDLQSYKGIRK